MVSHARQFLCGLVILVMPVAASGQVASDSDTGIPPNLYADAFRSTADLMWRAFPTFRAQCGRLAGKPDCESRYASSFHIRWRGPSSHRDLARPWHGHPRRRGPV